MGEVEEAIEDATEEGDPDAPLVEKVTTEARTVSTELRGRRPDDHPDDEGDEGEAQPGRHRPTDQDDDEKG
jgi:hypothetical protein